jgi:lipid-binding SYLF domain-containing protein
MNHICPFEGTRWRSYHLPLRIALVLLTVSVSLLVAAAQNGSPAPKRLTIGVALEGGLSKADCVLILPGVKKFSVGIGGSGGRGPLLCRGGKNFEGKWSAPAMYSVGGVSAGLQLGGTSSDFVLLLMDRKVVDQVLNGKTKMGADATAAAGPGATAAGATDADILTYGRAKGVFAGVSLGGASVEPDNDANYRLYGKRLTASDIVRGTNVKPPAGGDALVSLLDSKITKRSN